MKLLANVEIPPVSNFCQFHLITYWECLETVIMPHDVQQRENLEVHKHTYCCKEYYSTQYNNHNYSYNPVKNYAKFFQLNNIGHWIKVYRKRRTVIVLNSNKSLQYSRNSSGSVHSTELNNCASICDAVYQNQAYVGNAHSRERASLLVQGWKCRYWDFNTFEK